MPTAGWHVSLVGRTAELAALEQEWRRAASGQFRCVVVEGDPGIGKTRLVAELVARHRSQALILSARAHALGDTDSFGVWAEAFEGQLRSLGPGEVEELCGGFLDDLAALLRSAAAVQRPVQAQGAETPRARLLEGLAVLASNLARRAPVVAVLDDMHAADASSWETLSYLGHNLSDAPILVCAPVRPGELVNRAAGMQAVLALEQEGYLRRLRLGPLDTSAISRLAEAVLGRSAPDELIGWLLERSQGHPLFALGLLDALLEEGADLSRPTLRSVPEALADRVGVMVTGLEEPARATLELIAVLGRRVGLSDLCRLAARPLDRLGPILEELVGSRLVREEEQGRELVYEIAHPLVLDAIYERIGGVRRRALHRLVGRVLIEIGHPGEAAPHLTRSASTGDSEAIDGLLGALRQAEEREAHPEALAVLGALVELLPADDSRWLEVADVVCWQAEVFVEHAGVDDTDLGVKALRAVDRLLAGHSDPERRATVKSRLAGLLAWGTGDVDEAESACREAIALFQGAGQPQRALVATGELALILGIKNELVRMGELGREVLDAAGDDPLVRLYGLAPSLTSAYSIGAFDAVAEAIEAGVPLLTVPGVFSPATITVGIAQVGIASALEGRMDAALAFFEMARGVNPAWQDGPYPPWRAMVDWMRGDYPAVLQLVDDFNARRAGRMNKRQGGALACAAMAAVETGDLARARRHLDQAQAIYGDRNWFFMRSYCVYAEGIVAWGEGRPGEAIQLLGAAADQLETGGFDPFCAPVLADLAEVAWELRRPDAAAEAARRLDGIAGRVDRDLPRGLAGTAQAWAALASGQAKEAALAAEGAVDRLTTAGWMAYAGRALDGLGRAVVEDDRTAARERLRAAVEVFGRCGSVWRKERTLRMLGQLGGAGRRMVGSVHGPASLTARERQVVQLAAGGLSARDIADRLGIGERTVETHLARSYAKLGLRSKIDLVRRADEFGF